MTPRTMPSRHAMPRHPFAFAALAALGLCSACHDGASSNTASPSMGGSTAMTTGGAAAATSAAGVGGKLMVPPTDGLTGPPNCGLDAAAFCDGFDAPAKARGRGGDLDSMAWSSSRLMPQGPTANGAAFPVGGAVLPSCREGTPDLAWPPDDTLICDPNPNIKSSHLLVAVASQNYGINSYRIRQPFDFAGRTGKIVFDAQGYTTLGWISLEVTDEPIGVPSYAIFVNDEGGVLPKNGFEIQFSTTCGMGGRPTVFSWRNFHEFRDYADTVQTHEGFDCPTAQQGRLNHFEVTVAQDKVELFVTGFSADGVTFEEPKLVLSTAVNLPFTRGYVHISAHNHATLKYSTGQYAGEQGETDLDAWLAEWDNVGFDGAILKNSREYEAPDALTPTVAPFDDIHNPTQKGVNIGYIMPDVAMGASTPLTFKSVDLDGVKSAQLSVTAWYSNTDAKIADVVLKYRFNGGQWRDRKITPAEAQLYTAPALQGTDGMPAILNAIGQIIDVDPADLVPGDNTVEFATANCPQTLPAGIANIDLILKTE